MSTSILGNGTTKFTQREDGTLKRLKANSNNDNFYVNGNEKLQQKLSCSIEYVQAAGLVFLSQKLDTLEVGKVK